MLRHFRQHNSGNDAPVVSQISDEERLRRIGRFLAGVTATFASESYDLRGK